MSLTQQIGEQGFRWFLGIVVEIIGDPEQLGRVKVKVINEDDTVPDNDRLEWCQMMMPNTSECVNGVGDTPGLAIGSNIVGFYADGEEKKLPIILGTYPTVPNRDADKHAISWLARGKQTLEKQLVGPEPASAYAAQYPYNRVIQTKSGHVIELDDTPENERIHIYHRSGTYIEINNQGRMVIKSTGDSFDITDGTKAIHTTKDLDVSSVGTITLASKKSIKIAAPGGITVVEGSLHVKGSLGSSVGATGSFTTVTGQTVHVQNGLVTLID